MVDGDHRTARDVTVRGAVQGVGFRFRCSQEAERLGVFGWVRNEADRSVAGHFEGTTEAVEALVEWCRTGPSHADVEQVESEAAAPSGASAFNVE
ncbi:MAG: acylphosphatase [Nocardioides sp.]